MIHDMIQYAIEWPHVLTLNRIDFCSDYSDELISDIVPEIRAKHYSSHKKSVFVFPTSYWDVKGRENFEAEQKRRAGTEYRTSYRNIGARSKDRLLMTENDWRNIDTIYIGSKRSSNVQIAIYNKKGQTRRKKGRSSIGQHRIEIREVNSGRPSFDWLQEPDNSILFIKAGY